MKVDNILDEALAQLIEEGESLETMLSGCEGTDLQPLLETAAWVRSVPHPRLSPAANAKGWKRLDEQRGVLAQGQGGDT